ncbi:hypothetical protein ACFX13_007380 [Malus domestica]
MPSGKWVIIIELEKISHSSGLPFEERENNLAQTDIAMREGGVIVQPMSSELVSRAIPITLEPNPKHVGNLFEGMGYGKDVEHGIFEARESLKLG